MPVSQSHSHFPEWKYFSKGRVCPHQGALEKWKIPRGRGWQFTTSLDLFPLYQMGTVHLDGCGGATE